MNVGNSLQLVCMDRLFHILPGNVKTRPDRTLSSQDTEISTVNPNLTLRKNQLHVLDSTVFLHGWLADDDIIDEYGNKLFFVDMVDRPPCQR